MADETIPDETVADYDVRSPASRTLLTVLGTVLAVVLVGGLVLGASILSRETSLSTSTVEVEDAAQIVIDAGETDIRLVEGDDDVVTIRARITSGLRDTRFELGRKGDEIKLDSSCQTWLSPGCGVLATLEVPRGLPVVVRASAGDIGAEAIAPGVLTVETGSGNISVTDLEVDEFSARSASGDVRAAFATQPIGLKAATDSGDIRAEVPGGERTYVVVTKSKSGDVSSGIESDKGAEGFVNMTTDSGDITLDGG